jgi:hypothetical protein
VGAIYAFPVGATGGAVPAQLITGAATTLGASTRGAAADASGNIFAANGTVVKFTAGATGNVAPAATITTPVTAQGVAVF